MKLAKDVSLTSFTEFKWIDQSDSDDKPENETASAEVVVKYEASIALHNASILSVYRNGDKVTLIKHFDSAYTFKLGRKEPV